MKYIITIIISIVLCFQLFAQTSRPCLDDQLQEVAIGGFPSQSSTFDNGISSLANDGLIPSSIMSGESQNISRTNKENNAWWEIDLGQAYSMNNIEIWYADQLYNDGLKDFYILYSQEPFGTTNLSETLEKPNVHSLYVESMNTNGIAYPLDIVSAQYLRIQLADIGVLAFREITIPGGDTEICDNGIDDDCDGLVDCADSDCRPGIINVALTQPTCPDCNDGEIAIQGSGEDLYYSIDGGEDLISCAPNPICTFTGLEVVEIVIIVDTKIS